MHRMWSLVCVLFLVVLVSGVFSISNRVQQAEKKINRMQIKMDNEKEGLRVLQAEWTYLNSPQRLEKIARTYFSLQPVSGGQYIEIANIPLRATLDAQQEATISNEAEALAAIEPGVPLEETVSESGKPISLNIKRVDTKNAGNILPPPATLPLADLMPHAISISATQVAQ